MASRFRAALLVASPSYPNSVAWSDENLIAVATGHLVTILNPALLSGPRGLIMLSVGKPFHFGVVERKDLRSGCLLPTCLSRDRRPCVRSISWSPIGLALNGGCLLSICTTEGRVKLYRMPYREFSAEWVEVCDISELMYNYFSSVNFMESDTLAVVLSTNCNGTPTIPESTKDRKRKRQNKSAAIDKDPINVEEENLAIGCSGNPCLSSTSHKQKLITASKEAAVFSWSLLQEGSSVEVRKLEGQCRIWIAGTLSHFDGINAVIVFPEADDNGKQVEQLSMDPRLCETDTGRALDVYKGNQNNCAPNIRPSMNVGYLPQEILLLADHGEENILKIGNIVEAFTSNRWIEGTFMGTNERELLVKFHGDVQPVVLEAKFVRLAPIWIDQEKSWHITTIKIVTKDQELCKSNQIKPGHMIANSLTRPGSVPDSRAKTRKKMPEGSSFHKIMADQYASRSAMLSSLVVAWSPIMQSVCGSCSILAIGAKSGKISFWRIVRPQSFSITENNDPTSAFLLGILQAHSTWITAISWSLFASDAPDARLLLATGSSDGSMKIWLGYSEKLLKSTEVNLTPFSLLKEVISTNPSPISIITHVVSKKSPHKMNLAVGRGSGSFDVFKGELATSVSNFDKIGSYEAHHHVVTGLVWAFDGLCLYSCSQDNSVRGWSLCNDSLAEIPLPSTSLGVKSINHVPNVFDLCFGFAVSPGSMVIAVARSFDAASLNPMYEASSQAAVEFFWIGGQQINILSNIELKFEVEAIPGFSEEDFVYWSCNIIWSLNQYGNIEKPIVVWDVVEALLAFKQSAGKYVKHILAKWLISCIGNECDLQMENVLSQASKLLSKMNSRKLNILNIMIRRIILIEFNTDEINLKQRDLNGLGMGEDEHLPLWLELLLSSERELRERLFAFSFSAYLSLISKSSKKLGSGYWRPLGLSQMEKWVALNNDRVRDHLKLLAADIRKLKWSKLQSICEYVAEEQCSFCLAPVPFESTEVGFCKGANGNDGVGQSHKLLRCAASMQVCPLSPLWFCVCCHRRVLNLPPSALFRMPIYPLGFEFSSQTYTLDLQPIPFCPFCGILLQRMQPEFLLSTSPV